MHCTITPDSFHFLLQFFSHIIKFLYVSTVHRLIQSKARQTPDTICQSFAALSFNLPLEIQNFKIPSNYQPDFERKKKKISHLAAASCCWISFAPVQQRPAPRQTATAATPPVPYLTLPENPHSGALARARGGCRSSTIYRYTVEGVYRPSRDTRTHSPTVDRSTLNAPNSSLQESIARARAECVMCIS